MASSKTIKNRIRSTKNIAQITKAMEAVSAVKMRKSEQVALRARPYALAALEVLRKLTKVLDSDIIKLSPLLSAPQNKPKCLLVITSDKGLAGAFNINILKKAQKIIEAEPNTEIVAVGKKGRDFLRRRGFNVVREFTGAGDFVEVEETMPISAYIRQNFENRSWSSVTLLYANFVSALKQEIVARRILPFNFKSLNEIVQDIVPKRGKYANIPNVLNSQDIEKNNSSYIFEPSPYLVLNKLLPTLLEIEIHHAVLEDNASEHCSRMMAMRNASENATELISQLTLDYNKARQSQITKELTEITAGANALEY
jgi:F-type H+-transporting ATPase subunit gamma